MAICPRPCAGGASRSGISIRRLGAPAALSGTFQTPGRAVDYLAMLAASDLDLRIVVLGGPSAGVICPLGRGRAIAGQGDPCSRPSPLPDQRRGPASPASRSRGLSRPAARTPAGADTIDNWFGPRGARPARALCRHSPAAIAATACAKAGGFRRSRSDRPARFGEAYAAKARANGDRVQVLDLPGAGHFELIDRPRRLGGGSSL